MNGIRKDNYLLGESLVIAYSNPEMVSVTASVDQSDIAGIAIGDDVFVMISGYGNYQGKVTMINPITQAQSRTSVTYQVTVDLEGDVSALDSNLTAYVYFGMPDEMIQEMQNVPQDGGGYLQKNGKDVPKGEDVPGMEGVKEAPKADDRPQMEESVWQENVPQAEGSVFPKNGGKEDGQ